MANDYTNFDRNLINLCDRASLPVSGFLYSSPYAMLNWHKRELLAHSLNDLRNDLILDADRAGNLLEDPLTNYELARIKTVTIDNQQFKLRTTWITTLFDNDPGFIETENIEKKLAYAIIADLQVGNLFYYFVQFLHLQNPFDFIAEDEVVNFKPPEITDFRKIVETLSCEKTRFEIIRMKYMTNSLFETRSKTIDSYNVENSINPVAASRAIASNVKIADIVDRFKTNRATVSASSSRVVLGLTSLSIDAWEEVVSELIVSVNSHNKTDNLLNRFAQQKNEIGNNKPNSILIDVHAIDKIFTEDGGAKLTNGEDHDHDKILSNIIKIASEPFGLVISADGSCYSTGASEKIIPEVKIIPKKKIISLSLPGCNVKYGGTPISKIINKERAFRVTFEDPSVFYSKEGLYCVGDLRESAKILKKIIIAQPGLRGVSSEKGEPSSTSTTHPDESVFHYIQTHLCAGNDYVICDDGTSEWGDFLTLKVSDGKSCLTWFHAKMNKREVGNPLNNAKSSSGASALQVVVAQALKNLGTKHVSTTQEAFTKKIKYWKENYILPEGSVQTSIPRFQSRNGGTIRKFINDINSFYLNPNSIFEAAIVIPDYKKTMLLKILDRVGTGSGSYIDMQVFYLIGAFMGGCIEMGVCPVIHCRD